MAWWGVMISRGPLNGSAVIILSSAPMTRESILKYFGTAAITMRKGSVLCVVPCYWCVRRCASKGLGIPYLALCTNLTFLAIVSPSLSLLCLLLPPAR